MSIDPMAGVEVTVEALASAGDRTRAAQLHLVSFVLQALADGEPVEKIVFALTLEEPPSGGILFRNPPTLDTSEGQRTILADWLSRQIAQLVKEAA